MATGVIVKFPFSVLHLLLFFGWRNDVKMKTVGFSIMFVTVCQTIRHYIPEEKNLHIYLPENLKSHNQYCGQDLISKHGERQIAETWCKAIWHWQQQSVVYYLHPSESTILQQMAQEVLFKRQFQQFISLPPHALYSNPSCRSQMAVICTVE